MLFATTPTQPSVSSLFSTVSHPAATVYPDSDKIAIWTGNATTT
jgi:hypothetical protein